MYRSQAVIAALLCSLWLFGLSPQAASAQSAAGNQSPAPPAELLDQKQEIERLNKELQIKAKLLNEFYQQVQDLKTGKTPVNDPRLAEAERLAYIAYYRSYQSQNEHQIKLRQVIEGIYDWQISAANWILFVVIVISLSGVIYAGYEMISSRRLLWQTSVLSPASAQAQPEAPGVTTINIEAGRLQVQSAVIGIVILVLSLGFLYLFLKEVYTISPAPEQRPALLKDDQGKGGGE